MYFGFIPVLHDKKLDIVNVWVYNLLEMDNLPFKKWAKKRLIDLDLTQTQLAKKRKIPRNRVNDAINGRREGKKYLPMIILALKKRKTA